jgi:hypothetical protein
MSFLRVCEVLELDPAWVRRTVDRWVYCAGVPTRSRAFRRAA